MNNNFNLEFAEKNMNMNQILCQMCLLSVHDKLDPSQLPCQTQSSSEFVSYCHEPFLKAARFAMLSRQKVVRKSRSGKYYQTSISKSNKRTNPIDLLTCMICSVSHP